MFNKSNTLQGLNVPDQSVCFVHMSKYPRGKFGQEIFRLPAIIEWA